MTVCLSPWRCPRVSRPGDGEETALQRPLARGQCMATSGDASSTDAVQAPERSCCSESGEREYEIECERKKRKV
ncbi:hypothetical protein VNO80_01408 [Phaseolus coccineus]|uniref:Uncharacterized protein n=1 Tax=Phaseolus coccineus TaxID=3886 RepID=A0AAN9RST2_PHACN